MAATDRFSNYNSAFDQHDIQAMSLATVEVCRSLGISDDKKAAEVVASRIVELATRGERNPTKLRDRVVAEANGATWFLP